jgi:hypothetical protein
MIRGQRKRSVERLESELAHPQHQVTDYDPVEMRFVERAATTAVNQINNGFWPIQAGWLKRGTLNGNQTAAETPGSARRGAEEQIAVHTPAPVV